MALQKQIVSIPLTADGLDTKTSPALVDPHHTLELQNLHFVNGDLSKRNGYTALPGETGQGVALFQTNDEIDTVVANELLAYSPAINDWVSKDIVTVGAEPTERQIGGGSANKANADSAILSGIGLYAWEQSDGVYFECIDETNGAVYIPSQLALAGGSHPRVLALSGALHLFVMSNIGTVTRYTVALASPTVVPSGIGLSGGNEANTQFEVTDFSTYCILTTHRSGAIRVAKVSLPSFGITAVATATIDPDSFACAAVGTNLVLAYSDGATAFLFSTGFTTATLAWLVTEYSVAVAATNIPKLISLLGGSSSAEVYIQTQIGTDDNTISIYHNSLDSVASPIGATTLFLRSVGLASAPFKHATHTNVLVSLPSIDQPTTYLVNENGKVLGKYLRTLAGPLSTNKNVPHVNSVDSGHFTTVLGVVTVAGTHLVQGSVTATAQATVFGALELMLDLSQTNISHAQLGLDQHLATGSLLQAYDGTRVTEQGYNYFPPPLTAEVISPLVQWIETQESDGSTASLISLLCFPANKNDTPVTGVVPIAQLGVSPGEFFTLEGNDAGTDSSSASYFWYSVDGVGSDPGLGGFWTGNGIEVAVLSSDTSAQLATKTYTALTTGSPLVGTVTAPGTNVGGQIMPANELGYFPPNDDFWSLPAMNRQFKITITDNGISSSFEKTTLTACPGSLISGGQYFTFQGSIGGLNYVWYSVDGEGTDPKPGGYAQATHVSINSTDNASAVALATGLALIATGYTTTTQNGPQVTIKGPSAVVTPSTFVAPANPLKGGVAQNYLGAGDGFVIPATASPFTLGQVSIFYDTVLYQQTYSWVDAQNQLDQSSPGDPLFVTVPSFGPAKTAAVALSLPTYRVSEKPGVVLELWRTATSGSTSRKVTDPDDPIQNSALVDAKPHTDFIPDEDLADLVALYTTGGALPHEGPPATGYVTSIGDRLWLQASEDPSLWWFSNEFTNGNAVSWSSSNTIRVDAVAGNAVAAAVMDGNIILGHDRQLYVLSGNGPDVFGNGPFLGPTLVSPALGIRDARSLVLYDNGIIFKSPKGFWELSRKLQLGYIGAAVESFNDDTCSAATVIPGTTEIIFLSSDGTTLVFDYYYGQWATYTNHRGVDARVLNGVYSYLRNDAGTAYVYQQRADDDTARYSDNGVGYAFKFVGPWWKGGVNVQDYKRVWEFLVKGSFTGKNPIRCTIHTNYRTDSFNTYQPQDYDAGAAG